MTSQQAPRHRAASAGTRSHRLIPSPAASQRTVVIAAGSVFCAVFAFALATLPAHRAPGGAPSDQVVAADDSARMTQVDNASTLAPPASITRDPRRHPETVSALPQLGQQPLPGGPTLAGPAGPPGGPGSAPGGSVTGPGDSTTAPGGPVTGPGGPGTTAGGPAPSSSGGGSSQPGPGLPDPAQVAQAVFDAINSSRHDAGLRALRWDSRLQASAQGHNQAMANADTLSHQTSGEADLGQRESNAGILWWWAAENIGMSSELTLQAALGLETAMVNEQPPNDGHRQNILSRSAQAVGVDIMLDTAHHRLWLTEDFAQTSLL